MGFVSMSRPDNGKLHRNGLSCVVALFRKSAEGNLTPRTRMSQSVSAIGQGHPTQLIGIVRTRFPPNQSLLSEPSEFSAPS